MADHRKFFRKNSSIFRRDNLEPVVEEVVDEKTGEVRAKMMTPKLKRSNCYARLSIFLTKSPSNSPSNSSTKSSHSPSPTKRKAKLDDQEPPPVPAKLSKHDARQPSRTAPPPPPSYQQQPRSSSTPRPQTASTKLRKPDSPSRLQPRPGAQSPIEPQRRERSSSLAPPMTPNDSQPCVVSSPATSRPISYHSDQEANKSGRLNKRKSWLGGLSRSRNASADMDPAHLPVAWVVVDGKEMEYNLSFLTSGLQIPEMFSESSGDTYVYLFPRETGCQASFRIHSPTIASSALLFGLANESVSHTSRGRARSFDGRNNLAIEDTTRYLSLDERDTPLLRSGPFDVQSTSDESNESVRSLAEGPHEYHLYFPTKLSSSGPQFSQLDVQRLVDVRNLFAFLEGQPLLRTKANPTIFHILVTVASLLREFEYTNVDGSTYGEAVSFAFAWFLDIETLGDVRQSREKTIEGIILGEKMRSQDLYNEAFAHAVGKYEAVKAIKPDLYSQISSNTRNRLDRAFLDLGQRQRAANLRLTEFEFPSLFAGIAASTSSEESKYVHFKAWKSHFLSLRKVVLSYYKDLHGQWPPKASSKKNTFVEGGLNRLVLKGLYIDLCCLYDFLSDRESLTTRGFDASDDKDVPTVDPTAAALRRLLSEFDRSSPPVTPPIPFDIPLVPAMATLNPGYPGMGPKEQNMLSTKKLKDHETQLLVAKSHNMYSVPNTPFLEMFKAFEAKESRGKNCSQLADMRYGHWIFLYAVLQSLPMLVIDAPGLRYTEGVEYFLCEPSMGNLPWLEDAAMKREWYGIASSGHAVVLPSDLVVHGVEGIYRRSHCWTMAAQWVNESEAGSAHTASKIDRTEALSPLQPPPGFVNAELGVRPLPRDEARNSVGSSDGLAPEPRGRSRQSQRNSIAFGLERLPIPTSGSSPALSAAGSRGSSPGGLNLYDSGGRRLSSAVSSSAVSPSSAGEYRGSTFDDILGSMGNEDAKSKEMKEAGRGKGLKRFI